MRGRRSGSVGVSGFDSLENDGCRLTGGAGLSPVDCGASSVLIVGVAAVGVEAACLAGDTGLGRCAGACRGGRPGRSLGLSLGGSFGAADVTVDIGSAGCGWEGGICTISGFVFRDDSGPGLLRENPISLASC